MGGAAVKWWHAALGAGIAIVATTAIASPGFEPEGDSMHKITLWRKLESIGSLTNTQRYFLMLTAYGEGGYKPTAHNGSDGERNAARRALENNPAIASFASGCGIPLDNLRSGSWGTFQRLAPYWTSDMREIFGGGACVFADPTRAPNDLDLQIVDAIHIARSLQGYTGWKAYPTVGNLRLGWANPSFMGYISDHADRLAKYAAHAEKVNLPDGVVDWTIERFPDNAAQIYAQLRGAG
jgi:hypothetical protein